MKKYLILLFASMMAAAVMAQNLTLQQERKFFHKDKNDKLWRIRANGAYALSGFNRLGNNSRITVTDNNEMALGLDIGGISY